MELLVKICSYFCSHCSSYGTLHYSSDDNQCLVSLSRTSRALRVAAEDVLRHACVLDDHTWYTIPMCEDEQRLAKFIWKICQDDEAASSVKSVSLLRPVQTGYWEKSKEFRAMQRAMLDKHGIKMQLRQSASQVVAGLTHAAPNLESLRFVCSDVDLAQDWVNARPLIRLKSLELIPERDHNQRPRYGMDFNLTVRLFELTPNLETLRIAGFTIFCRQTPPCGEYPRCTHETQCSLLPRTLSSIVMEDVVHIQLVHLFDDCPNLIDVEIFIKYPSLTHAVSEPAFAVRRESLQRLVVSVEDWFPNEMLPEEAEVKGKEWLLFNYRPGRSGYNVINMHFGGMTALKHLAVDQCLLFSELCRYSKAACEPSVCEWTAVAAVLPASLEILHVGVLVAWVHMHAFLAALYDARLRGELVHLRTVRLTPHYAPSSVMIPRIDLLGKMLKSIGVHLIRMKLNVPDSYVGKRRHLLSASLHDSY